MSQKTKTLIVRILLFGGTAISMFFVPWILVKAWIWPLPDSTEGQLDQALNNGFDGVVIYADQGGKDPIFAAAGWHNKEEKIPARPDALFKIASIAKLYDAVTLTKLVGAGKLSLDGTLAEYLPELKNRIQYADQITIKMMIQHRSGIPNYTDTQDFWANPERTYEENLGLILDQPALFKPDEDYAYCNTNYLLLGQIMDRVLGYPKFQFVQQEILDPLNLENTYASVNDVDPDRVMSGYHLGHPYDLKADDLGFIATAEDVGIFLRALNDGTLFKDGEQDIYSSIYEYEHDGWVPGYQSFSRYDEKKDLVMVTFYSTTDSELLLWNVSQITNNRFQKIITK